VIERQLHDEGHVLAAEQGVAEHDAGDRQHDEVGDHEADRHVQGLLMEEGRGEEGQHQQACAARHQGGEQDGEQPAAPRLDHPRAHHRGHVAAEAETQRQEALAVQTEVVHEAVHDIAGAREVAGVFQQAEGDEEHQQDGQEGDHDAGAAKHPVSEQTREPGR